MKVLEKKHVPVLVVDFGSQTTQLILRRVRELGVYCEVVSHKDIFKCIKECSPKAIIFSGGPASAFKKNAPKVNKKVYELIEGGESIAQLSRKSGIPYYSLYNTHKKVKEKLKKIL